MFNRFGTIPACDRQTDGQMDRHDDSIYRAVKTVCVYAISQSFNEAAKSRLQQCSSGHGEIASSTFVQIARRQLVRVEVDVQTMHILVFAYVDNNRMVYFLVP